MKKKTRSELLKRIKDRTKETLPEDKELQRRGTIGLTATTSGKYNHNLVATVKFVF